MKKEGNVIVINSLQPEEKNASELKGVEENKSDVEVEENEVSETMEEEVEVITKQILLCHLELCRPPPARHSIAAEAQLQNKTLK